MKKFMMIALVAIGFIVIATPESNAGVSIGIGFGLPAGFCGYPAYYPYGYYPYGALIIRLLSITAACTGLTIGGTAVGFLFGTATSAKVVSRASVRSRARVWLFPNAF